MSRLPPEKQITRSQLSELALDAAIEMDLGAEEALGPNVQSFLSVINDQVRDVGGKSVLKDETLFPVYSFALSSAKGEGDETSRRDSMDIILRVFENFRAMKGATDRTFLKDFCLFVHEALIRDLSDRRMSTVRRDERVRFH